MLHYFAKNFFAPTIISAYERNGDLIISGISDLTYDLVNVDLTTTLWLWNSLAAKYTWTHNCTLVS